MRIGVNLLPFQARLAGAGQYARNISRELVRADSVNEYVFFVTRKAAAHFVVPARNVSSSYIDLPTSSFARVAFEQLGFPFRLTSSRIDALFTLSVALPLAWRGKRVTVIHDMIAEHRDVAKYPPLRNAYVRWMSRYAAQHSDAVITVSQCTRREIAEYARVPLERISVAPDAVEAMFTRVSDAETLAAVRARYKLPQRFILYLGTLEPGKNLARLVQAFARFKQARPELPHALVLAGGEGWSNAALDAEIRKVNSGTLQRTGFVEQAHLPALYSLADAFVYPSLYEGFGLPVLEAMACGTPVIASDVSALPEVVGGAGLLVAPTDVNALADSMIRVLTDDALRARLQRAGLERAQDFRWEQSAQVILQRIKELQ